MDDQLTLELSNQGHEKSNSKTEADQIGSSHDRLANDQSIEKSGGADMGSGSDKLNKPQTAAGSKQPSSKQRVASAATNDSAPKPHVVQIALQMKIKELELRYKNLLFFSLAALLVFLLIVMYSVKTYHQSVTEIEENYDEISQLLTSAYRGDPIAHKEIVDRFPLITQSRLPRTLRSPQQSSFKPPQNNNVAVGGVTPSNVEPDGLPSAIIPVETPVSPVDESAKLRLYSDKSEDSIELGSVTDDSEIISIKRYDDWSRVMLASGVPLLPLWISRDHVFRINDSLLRVRASDVRLRIKPGYDDADIVTLVNKGDTLQLIADKGSWLQVYSPADYQAWVKTAELQALVE